MSDVRKSTLDREVMLNAFRELSDELGRCGATGELCVFGGTVLAACDSAKSQYLVEGLFAEGRI